MFRVGSLVLLAALLAVSGGATGQDPKKDEKKVEKKAEPTKYKGVLPSNWKKLGLTDTQVQDVYRIQNKYGDEIDKLEAKIREMKSARDKEAKAVLTPEQKKRLDEILTGK